MKATARLARLEQHLRRRRVAGDERPAVFYIPDNGRGDGRPPGRYDDGSGVVTIIYIPDAETPPEGETPCQWADV
jgi:hypothetical protein